MGIVVKKKEGESSNSLIYRFTKKVQQSGVLRESKKRRFSGRVLSKAKQKRSAIYRAAKAADVAKQKKLGTFN